MRKKLTWGVLVRRACGTEEVMVSGVPTRELLDQQLRRSCPGDDILLVGHYDGVSAGAIMEDMRARRAAMAV